MPQPTRYVDTCDSSLQALLLITTMAHMLDTCIQVLYNGEHWWRRLSQVNHGPTKAATRE